MTSEPTTDCVPEAIPSADLASLSGASRAQRWANRLPRWMRVASMGVLFFFFFLGCPVIALGIMPVLRLFYRDHRRRFTRLLNRGLRFIIWTGRFLGTVDFVDPVLPASVDATKPYVMICNHPTYVDMLLLLGSFPEMTCVTSGRWSRHWALGPLLRATDYLPGPGSGLPESEHMLESMIAHLRQGHPLLVFPEGKRSLEGKLRRFRRGAVEAATAAHVPIVPLFLAIDRPYLTKQVPLWKPPSPAPTYSFEFFDVVRPEAFDDHAKRIQRHLEGLYKDRFSVQHARQTALRALPASS